MLTKRAVGKLAFEGTPENVSIIVKSVLPLIGISFVGEKVVSEKPRIIEIYGKCGFSMKSYGEKVEIKVTEIDDGQSLIEAESKCVDSDQLFDYGKNKKNLENLFGELKKQLKPTTPVYLEEKRL